MKKKIFSVMLAIALALCLAVPQQAAAVSVDLELLLLCDVSGSVDATDFDLIRGGYEAAFRDASIINSITTAGTYGSIAVSLVYWSDSQSLALDWMYINSEASSYAFADAIAGTTRPFFGGTQMAAAMNYGYPLFTNAFEGTRQVIDVTGDGADSISYAQIAPNVQDARDAALASGVDTINALFVNDRDYFGDDPEDSIQATPYGEDNVIGGTNPFVWVVASFDDFGLAVKEKIGEEVNPSVPEPLTMVLLMTGIVGLAGFRRKC